MKSTYSTFTFVSTTFVEKFNSCRKIAFTLAEVLITLGIIGVVAALTLPTLMKNIKAKVEANQVSVIEKKLIQGLNLLNSQDNGLSVAYNSSEDFVKALSKHMKIVTICGKNELSKCMSYDSIRYNDKNGKETTVKLDEMGTADKLNIKAEGFSDLAGFVTGDGTPFIISYNQQCATADPDRPFKTISDCVAGIYDLNGAKGPNRFGMSSTNGALSYSSDIHSFNGARLGCVVGINGLCAISTAWKPTGVTCNSVKDELGIECGNYMNIHKDYWAAGAKACKDLGGRLPSYEELNKLAQIVYEGNVTNSDRYSGPFKNKQVLTQLGLDPDKESILWEQRVDGDDYAYYRLFNPNYTYWGYHNYRFASYYTLCVSD